MLPGIGRLGAGSCTIFSQRRQDFFSRAISRTFSCATTMSRISLTSSPTGRRSPPQSGQQVPGSSSRRSRGVDSDTRGRRRGLRSAVSPVGVAGAALSSADGVVSPSAAAISRSSSASSSCSISRSTFSEDLPKACFFSFAMRSRSTWISWSWARIVADILALSACKAAIIAFRSVGSSGRIAASPDMPKATMGRMNPP